MPPKAKHFSSGLLLGMVAMLLLLLIVLLAIAYSGRYNVAASAGHTAGMRWWLDTTMHASVREHARESISPPAEIDLAAGAGEYKAMCEHCHGGPGIEPSEWSRGMLPQPPHLVEEASEWRQAEVFWIVRHGIKYTGMPSFGENHDDPTLWNIAAFVDQLPGMTPQQYRSAGAGHSHGAGGMHGDPHGSTDTHGSEQQDGEAFERTDQSQDAQPSQDPHPEHDHDH